jgi:hypothetical protein
VELRVHTNGDNVETVDVTRSAQLLDQAAAEFVRAWRFSAHEPRSFDSAVTFGLLEDDDCHPLATLEGEIDAPRQATVRVPMNCVVTLDGGVPDPEPIGPTLRGVVRCSCHERFPVADVRVSLFPKNNGSVLKISTGSDGAYDFRDLPDGDYNLSLQAVGFLSDHWTPLRIKKRAPLAPVRDDRLAPDSLQITSLDIPAYPERAIAGNLQGQVHVRANGRGHAEVLDGDPILAASALANVLSWHSTGGQGTDVTYTYSLVDDCENPNPHVTMKLPFEVNVVGKRRTSCGGAPPFHVFHGPSW